MKKSKVVKKLTRLLKKFEDSKMGAKQAHEIIDLLQAMGMEPPFSKQADYDCECGCKGRCPKGHNWDNEYWADDAKQVEVYYR